MPISNDFKTLFGSDDEANVELAQAAVDNRVKNAMLQAGQTVKGGSAYFMLGQGLARLFGHNPVENDPTVIKARMARELQQNIANEVMKSGGDPNDPEAFASAASRVALQQGNTSYALKMQLLKRSLAEDKAKSESEAQWREAQANLMKEQAGVVQKDAETRRIAALRERGGSGKNKPYTPSAPTGSQISGLKDWIAEQEGIAGFIGTKGEKGWTGEKDIFLTTVARDLHDRTETRIAKLVAQAKRDGVDPEYDRQRIREEEFDKLKAERIKPGKEQFFGLWNTSPEYRREGTDAAAEAWIARAMKANPGMSREDVIKEGKKAGKL